MRWSGTGAGGARVLCAAALLHLYLGGLFIIIIIIIVIIIVSMFIIICNMFVCIDIIMVLLLLCFSCQLSLFYSFLYLGELSAALRISYGLICGLPSRSSLLVRFVPLYPPHFNNKPNDVATTIYYY